MSYNCIHITVSVNLRKFTKQMARQPEYLAQMWKKKEKKINSSMIEWTQLSSLLAYSWCLKRNSVVMTETDISLATIYILLLSYNIHYTVLNHNGDISQWRMYFMLPNKQVNKPKRNKQ